MAFSPIPYHRINQEANEESPRLDLGYLLMRPNRKILRFLTFMAVQSGLLVILSSVYLGLYSPQTTTASSSVISPLAEAQVNSSPATVLGAEANVSPTPEPAKSQQVAPVKKESAPKKSTIIPIKSSYKIAIFGDSMVDTMGENLEYLDKALKKKYPNTQFTLYNYGIGAETVEMGLARFDKSFSYQTRSYQTISQVKPDIIIVASFAYNPFTPHDRDKHWLTLTHLIQKAQTVTNNVYILAEIAPLRRYFGRGPNGVNWDENTALEHSGRIIEQLQNAVGLSKTLRVPIINAFEKSIVNHSTNEGKREYVNDSDGIHPSVKGHEFTADEIVSTLVLR